MDIKRADSKGRISVGAQGEHYWTEQKDDGTIVLHPINVPEFPKFGSDMLEGVYWDIARGGSRPESILIYSPKAAGYDLARSATFVASIANELKLSVFVEASGFGSAAADLLMAQVDGSVLKRP